MFEPRFTITPSVAKILMKLEALNKKNDSAAISSIAFAHLRATARMNTVHYSTKIEGNCLTLEEIEGVIKGGFVPGKERDTHEILGYYAALEEIDRLAKQQSIFAEDIHRLHAIVMGGGNKQVRPTSYRTDQNAIKNSATRKIVYSLPEAQDVPALTADLLDWINRAPYYDIPVPLVAGIAHYQFVTIHPYHEGNERMARLLAMLILHQGGYALNGICCLEEFYAKDLTAYYGAMTIGPSHNYYFGRAEADISAWCDYFCRNMFMSFEKAQLSVSERVEYGVNVPGSHFLDERKRAILELFAYRNVITAKDVGALFNIKPRTARYLCQRWVEDTILVVKDSSKKLRSYALAENFKELI